ncbi:GNAT family N-acetyltransferase [Dyella soli]|uniref:GNAT family N-acetyltransferase n=1 Tax=Dyella soli TaxID=522319 RepID=A0A4R0YX98_9GAMM|nr:GNAT family N-acetyltransferase [Dyella soli]TCI11282.1 GNAT family N-acetyltransferase [Dyella soli]
MTTPLTIRDIRHDEHGPLGQLMVEVYSQLEGFPSPVEQPRYYEMLANIGDFATKVDTRVLVAMTGDGLLVGGVVYFGDMAAYGSGGTATAVTRASGIRLLGVSPLARGMGVGRALTEACIRLARDKRHARVVLHTTEAMRVAWSMYERLGFERTLDLDFMQGALPVFGFSLWLDGAGAGLHEADGDG